MTIGERLSQIRDRIDRAARRAARDPAEVQLVAVSKTQPASAIREAFAAGLRAFGENYAQELARKAAELHDLDVAWHFIGALQRNKAKDVLPIARVIHTVDRAALVDTLDARAVAPVDVLIEVNVSSEAQKSGVDPDGVVALASHAAASRHVKVRGLMAVPEAAGDAERVRPAFARLRALRDDLVTRGVSGGALSMGMSHDFEIAIEEGATIVRVGTALFGQRPPAEAR